MRNFIPTDRQPASRISLLALTILSILHFALPTFADATLRDADKTAAAPMLHSTWQQDVKMLDDTELLKVHGKGISSLLPHPEIIPAIILWDESDKRRSGAASQNCIRINISSTNANTR